MATASTRLPNESSKLAKGERSKEGRSTEITQARTAPARKNSLTSKSRDIHIVDMTGTRNDNEYAKVGPRDYKSLHRLHEKVNGPAPTRVLPQTKPTFSYAQGEQPRFSFLDSSRTMYSDIDHISSDYGDGWMDDLPSTSALLGQNTHVEEGPTTAFARSPLSGPFEQARDSAGAVRGTHSPFEEDISELEATLIGLDDSRKMGSQARNTIVVAGRWSPGDDRCSVETAEQKTKQNSPSLFSSATLNKPGSATAPRREERLFLSTDSPEKTSVASKRHRPVTVGDPLCLLVHGMSQRKREERSLTSLTWSSTT